MIVYVGHVNEHPILGYCSALIIGGWGLWGLFCVSFPTHGRKAQGTGYRYWYAFKNNLGDIFHPKNVAWLSGAIAVYGSADTLWGKSHWFFLNHPDAHRYAKLIASICILVIAIAVTMRERWKERSLAGTEVVLKGFVSMVANIVQNKIGYLSERAKTVSQSKKYDHVTDPIAQLKVIFKESATFLTTTFSLKEDQIDISIIEKNGTNPWKFLTSHQTKWSHGDPDSFFKVDSKSCASTVIKSGQDAFHASKKVAAAEDEYELSERDKQTDDGSIFCIPIKVSSKASNWIFVVSIVTYGRRFCNPHDKRNEEKVIALLKEITRRIELELTHRVIKNV
jgi:hypothetical protein